jgi:mannose-1-phosphate guanylyltransferase/phosphomannomutase
VAVRLAAALGTALKRGDRVVCSRDAPPGCRMIKRAMIAGLNSTGVDVADLRVLPAAVNRHLLKTESFDAGFHVGISYTDPEVVEISFFEYPGIQLTASMQKEIEKHFSRLELRRAAHNAVGSVSYPARVRETYAHDLLATLDRKAIRERGFRIVVDYGYSAASYVLPLVLGPLGIEAISAHAFVADSAAAGSSTLRESIGQAKRLVPAVGADFGAVFDRAAERLFLIDERGREIPVEQTLLLWFACLARTAGAASWRFRSPSRARSTDREGTELEVVRTPASLAELTSTRLQDGVVFAGALGGGYVFPEFLPAYDAVASLCKLLELLAPTARPVSELVGELPVSTLVHRQLPCPWAMKGLVMRVLSERLRDRSSISPMGSRSSRNAAGRRC